jgi:hypothetical protein
MSDPVQFHADRHFSKNLQADFSPKQEDVRNGQTLILHPVFRQEMSSPGEVMEGIFAAIRLLYIMPNVHVKH